MKFLRLIIFSLATLCLTPGASADDIVRILAIGNSFSEDAVEQNLHEICASRGHQVIIGNLFIPACSVDTHCLNAEGDLPAYSFRKIDVAGHKTVTEKCRLSTALSDEKWDYICFQQASQYSGIFTSLTKLQRLLSNVRRQVGDTPLFLWQMTWAYAPGSNHAGFDKYGNSELRMYHDIVRTTMRVMDVFPDISLLIPTGTAIQNARTAISLGWDMTRDGYHLNLTVGRYIAALTWYAAIFRSQLPDNIWLNPKVSAELAPTCRRAVLAAIETPYAITQLPAIALPRRKH